MAKAMDDVLVCLRPERRGGSPGNGYPLRLIVPGWEGNVNVKWLRRIKVVDRPCMTRMEAPDHTGLLARRQGPGSSCSSWRRSRSSPSRQQVSGCRVPACYEIRGLAWSGRGFVRRVEISHQWWKDLAGGTAPGAHPPIRPHALRARLAVGRARSQFSSRGAPTRPATVAADAGRTGQGPRPELGLSSNNAILNWKRAGPTERPQTVHAWVRGLGLWAGLPSCWPRSRDIRGAGPDADRTGVGQRPTGRGGARPGTSPSRPMARGLPPGRGTAVARWSPCSRERRAACHGRTMATTPKYRGSSLRRPRPLTPAEFSGENLDWVLWRQAGPDDRQGLAPCHHSRSYINRAQLPDEPGSLTPDQVYAVTAYLLYLNGIIGEDRRPRRLTLAGGEDAKPRRLRARCAPGRGTHRRPEETLSRPKTMRGEAGGDPRPSLSFRGEPPDLAAGSPRALHRLGQAGGLAPGGIFRSLWFGSPAGSSERR